MGCLREGGVLALPWKYKIFKTGSDVDPLAGTPLALLPDETAGEVTGEVERLLYVLVGEMSRQQIQDAFMLKHPDHFRTAYLTPALATNLLEMTQPDKPRSSRQRYRLTATGQRWIQQSSITKKDEQPTSINEMP